MTPKRFQTPTKLGITKDQFSALNGIRLRLERGELKHGKNFNMAEWHCGSAGCIGGWADHLYGTNFNYETNSRLDLLFFPSGIPRSCENIRSDEAAKAIDNFLTHGEPRWSEVITD